jgi:hypothetical protein
MNDQALRDYFGFDEYDLTANRNGSLSEKQIQKLEKELGENIRKGSGIGGISLVSAFIFLLISFFFFKPLGELIFVTVTLALICALIGLLALRRASLRKSVSNNLSKDIAMVEGPISIEHGRSSDECFLYIGKEEFDITEEIAAHLDEADTYCIYFEIESHTLLSLEWLSKG